MGCWADRSCGQVDLDTDSRLHVPAPAPHPITVKLAWSASSVSIAENVFQVVYRQSSGPVG